MEHLFHTAFSSNIVNRNIITARFGFGALREGPALRTEALATVRSGFVDTARRSCTTGGDIGRGQPNESYCSSRGMTSARSVFSSPSAISMSMSRVRVGRSMSVSSSVRM